MSKNRRRRSAALTIMSTALVLTLAGPASALAGSAPTADSAPAASAAHPSGPRVPTPTAHRPVGTASARLVDSSRPDPWRADAPTRELMVTFWYPAKSARGTHPPYVSPELSRALYGLEQPATLRTGAVADARPAAGRHPLILLSPGFGMSRTTLTALGEEFASRGYAVAAVDSTYETSVEFPGGRIESCRACGQEQTDPEFGAKSSRARAADLRFVIDRLTGPGHGGPVRGLSIDASRIGAAGHSIGGAAALEAMREDPRIKAAANLDGSIWIPAGDDTGRPALLFGAGVGSSPESTRNWEDNWKRFTGPRYWVDLPAGGHLSFSDSHWMVDDLHLEEYLPPGYYRESYGSVDSHRALAATRAYLGAFFDRHLLGRPAPLLDRPSPRFPEVRFAK
ncbi:alpha/beta hydrolase family protein [Kitasatospora sp. NPDC057692]|uniref:alpha/beta hydrolase family protein n=1 Tax=Kitasatospora sp. NPDC057692 TaxID=3346215 RepID=UPI0036949748